MKIRAGRLDDAERLLAFWSAAAYRRSTRDDLAGVTRLLRHDPDSVLVNEVDEVVVGTVVAAWDGWRYRNAGYMPDSSCMRRVRPPGTAGR